MQYAALSANCWETDLMCPIAPAPTGDLSSMCTCGGSNSEITSTLNSNNYRSSIRSSQAQSSVSSKSTWYSLNCCSMYQEQTCCCTFGAKTAMQRHIALSLCEAALFPRGIAPKELQYHLVKGGAMKEHLPNCRTAALKSSTICELNCVLKEHTCSDNSRTRGMEA